MISRYAAISASAIALVAWLGAPAARADKTITGLTQVLAAAPKLETEDMCEPVKSVRQGMLLWAPNPDGRTWDILQIYFPRYGGPNTIVVIDLGTSEVKKVQTDRGWNFHLCPAAVAPNGKLFISVLDGRLRQKICVYDPASNELTLDAVKMPETILGETHPLVLGTDGKLYAIGQHPSKTATAAQIDTDTLQVTSYGPIGPSHEPDSCWGYSGGADDRYIYIASGKVPWYLVAYDRREGKWETLATTETVEGYVGVSQRPDGCIGHAVKIVNSDGKRVNYWLHEGKALPTSDPGKEKPPWPERKKEQNAAQRPEVNDGLATPDSEGNAEIWARTAEAKARAPKDAPPDAEPGDLGWQRFRFQVPLYPHAIYRLMELPDGRLFGTAGAYEGNFFYDPRTNQGKHQGKIHLSHYSTALCGGRIYMSGYPASPLYVFDPGRAWTAGTFVNNSVISDEAESANPRRLMYLGAKELAGTHKMFAAAVADHKVYFGGEWVRDGACGGVAWYDTKTGKAGGFWRPISNRQVTHMAAVNDGRTVVISTKRVEDTVLKKPKPEQGALLFLDTRKDELTGMFEPVAKAKGAGSIAGVGSGRVMGWTEDPTNDKASILYLVDVNGSNLVFKKTLPVALPVGIGSNQQEAWDFRPGPDGKVWTFMNGVMVRIDPGDGAIEALGKPDVPGRIAFADGRIFLGGTPAVRRVKNLECRREQGKQ